MGVVEKRGITTVPGIIRGDAPMQLRSNFCISSKNKHFQQTLCIFGEISL